MWCAKCGWEWEETLSTSVIPAKDDGEPTTVLGRFREDPTEPWVKVAGKAGPFTS